MKRLLLAAVLIAALPLGAAIAQESPSTGPVVAEARAIPESVELTGSFEPASSIEVKIDLESYNQPLKIQEAAAHGQQVKKGEVLLAVEAEPVQRALAAAESRKAVADVQLRKAMTDSQIGDQADALARRAAERALRNAEEALSWFESVDGEQMLQQAEMMVMRAQDSIDDQTEELAQLQKMYQSEELTEDTADIVIKRAMRQLRYQKEMFELTRKRAQKVKEKDYADQRQNLIDALDAQRLAILQLENDQAARLAQRQANQVSAEEAARQATEAWEKLKADAEKLNFEAPEDGYVFVGQFNGGNWSNADPALVEAGKEIKPDQVVMTFFRPSALQIKADLPEKDRFRITEGASVTITPSALPGTKLEGKVAQISPLVLQKGPNRVFEVVIEPAEVDSRIAPGFTAKVEVAAETREYPMVPAGYVVDGKLRVQEEGQVRTIEVKTGKTDGGLVQVIEGLEAGTTVLPPEKAAEAQKASDVQPGAEQEEPAEGEGQ